MLSFLRAALVVLVASAVAANAAPSLTVMTSVPNVEVNGVQNLKVTVTLFNTGNETLKLLNDPRGVLDSFPEHSFTITNANGSSPSFNGAKVKYSPTYAAGLDDPSVFTVLAPGVSANVTHDLSAAYNFTRSGAGGYSIEPSNLLTYVDVDGTLKNLYATVGDVAKVELSGNLAVSRVYDRRDSSKFPGCSTDEQLALVAAAAIAQSYVREAYNYLKSLRRLTARYYAWFGWYSDPRKKTVEEHFSLINSHKFSDYIYDCTDRYRPYYAYVRHDQFGTIYICKIFYWLLETGSNSRAGTLIHEASHFTINGGTEDYAYGRRDSMVLAITNPGRAVMNAESHQGFAENDPRLP